MKRIETSQNLTLKEGCFLMLRSEIQCFAFTWGKGVEFDPVQVSGKWLEAKLLGFGEEFDRALKKIATMSAAKAIPTTFRKMQSGQTTEIKFSVEEGRVQFAGKSQIRVLIVDDSQTIRKILKSVLSEDPGVEVVGMAEKPSAALTMIPELRPDVITLDIHMPEMNGVELLRKYIANYPIPTVMISSISREEGTFVFDALDSGAVDYLQKPTLENLKETAPLIIEKVKLASKAKILARARSIDADRSSSLPLSTSALHSSSEMKMPRSGRLPSAMRASLAMNNAEDLIVIGSSTGGTEALKEVLMRLPEKIPPILVVQHIPPVFSAALAQRLDSLCPFTVKEAQDGDLVTANTVYIAPGATQMKLSWNEKAKSLALVITDDAPVNRHKPSVDYLFDSVAELPGLNPGYGVILTGMGADGARGLLKLRNKGWRTIAQNEETCVVYGMPKEAVKMGAAERVLPLYDIAENLREWKVGGKEVGKKIKVSA